MVLRGPLHTFFNLEHIQGLLLLARVFWAGRFARASEITKMCEPDGYVGRVQC